MKMQADLKLLIILPNDHYQRSQFWLSVHLRPPKKFVRQPKILMQMSVDNHTSVAKTNIMCIFIYSKYGQPDNQKL